MASIKTGQYRDVISSRGGRDSALSFAGNFTIKILAIDPSWTKPPEFYEYDRFVDRVYIGNHFGFVYQLNFAMILKGSAIPPNVGLWKWDFVCDVDIVYPDGFVKSGRISLGSELVDPAVTRYKDVSFPVTFNSNTIFENIQYVDINESYIPWTTPPETSLKLYELIPLGTRQNVSVTVTGLNTGTISDNVHSLSAQPGTDYQFTVDTKLHSKGATANLQDLSLSPLTINELALPNYNYLHVIDSNNYFFQTTAVDSKVQGVDNGFGEPQYRYIEANTLVTLERNVDVETIIHAWQDSYPDDLTIRAITSGTGGTTEFFTASGGSGLLTKSWKKYSFASNISGSTNSLNFDNLPSSTSQFSLNIVNSSLVANGDTAGYTRIPFRSWWQPGADIYHKKNSILPGTGNSRTFSQFTGGLPLQNFSAYRYLDITAGNATTVPQVTTLYITSPFESTLAGQVVLEKELVWNPGTSTKKIDLCFAGTAHTLYPDLQNQDNPYPRVDNLGVGRYINQDLYGIGCVRKIETVGSVNVSEYKLTRYDNSAKASFIGGWSSDTPSSSGSFPAGLWPVYVGATTRARRFWEQDVNGKNEEEYDIVYFGPSPNPYYGLSIQELCNNIQSRPNPGTTGGSRGVIHQGWIASPSGPTTGDLSGTNLGWFNPGAAWAAWLNGFGLQCIAGIRNFSILRDLSEESGDRDIYAQQVFDKINSLYPPDYFDAFQIEAPGATSLKLVAFSIQRSAAHGLVQEQKLGEIVDLNSTSGILWGQGTTDFTGSYQTGLTYGKAQNPAVVNYAGNSININKLFSGKRSRAAFYVLPVPPSLIVLSADISGFYQHCIGTIESGIVKLVFTTTPNFTTFDVLTTNITGMSNVAICWNHPTNSNEMILVAQRTSDSAIIRYELNDFVNGVAGMGTVIGNGTTPAIAINNNGTSIIFWRTSSSNIQRIIIDSAGNITTAASNVIVGNVDDKGLGCYWLDDQVFLVYNHTTNGLTVVKSNDYGQTFS